jgi:TRAP-type C4-dicarboxylate transport system permease small subunit
MSSSQIKEKLDRTVATALILLMALMVLNVTWQVISRYIFQNPSSFTDELSRYMLIWMGMLGAAYVAGKDQHLAIDLFQQRLARIAKVRLKVFIYLIVILFALLVMVLGGANLVYITFILQQKSATLQLPLAYVYTIIPVSGLLVIYYQVYGILYQLKDSKS